MKQSVFVLLLATLACASPLRAADDDDRYVDIPTDLATAMELLEVAERAHDNVHDYFEPAHGHPRDEDHEHGEEIAGLHFDDDMDEDLEPDEDGDYDEHLSAYEAVGEIWLNAHELKTGIDPEALDIVKVVVAVVDAWNRCDDTFGAVKRGVELMPDRAAEIAAAIAIKRDCNCAAGGIWPQQRVENRLRVDFQHAFIDVPRACSCSQAAMYGAIAGLPENGEYMETAMLEDSEEKDAQLARITRVMVEKSNEVIERTNAAQSRNDWSCNCSNVNLAASMRGIEDDGLREGTWDGLAQKYVDEAGDTGLVVDAFGIVGMYPLHALGSPELNSNDHVLRRQPLVYRGDPLLLDPFDPSHEWFGTEGRDFSGLGRHEYESVRIPTDLFISEYVIGAQQMPVAPELVRTTITLSSEVTFDLDKYDIRAEASPVLERVAALLSETGIVSEILIEGHTCDLATDEYNQLLSERRAEAVRDFLVGAGLADVTIRTAGQGEGRPRFANDTEENRSRNRRVEITFLTRDDREIQRSLSEADSGSRSVEFTFVRPEDRAAWEAAVKGYEVRVVPLVRRDEDFNRLIEIYNGSDRPIEMGQDQYFLEIYGEECETEPVAVPVPKLQKNRITLDSGVTFELDKWAIREEAGETLRSIVEVINRADIFSEILIEGHTCDLATDEYNQLLSERRAESVRDFLLQAGLEVDAIRIEGHGEHDPRLPNTSEENRAQNRRVEITFVTRGGREIQRTVSEHDGRRQVEFNWVTEAEDSGAVEQVDVPLLLGSEYFCASDDDGPREVIGLNGRIEPGETFIVAWDGSEEELTDLADIVTGQLDFLPNETLVLRRFGGARALACKAYTYAFLNEYEASDGIFIPLPEPIELLPDPICTSPTDCDGSDQASPN
jgi:outer membrane protein OmpA-like peptidoglycan-associated protein